MLDPNEHQTWHEVNEMVIRCLAMHQNAFLIQNRRGSASDFPDVTPVHPARVTIQTSGDAFFYDVSAISNGEATILGFSGSRRLSEADVVHIKGRMHTGEQGLSTLLLGQNILGLNQALQDFQTAAAANGIRPNAVITTDANLNDEQFARLKVEIKEMLKSATDSGTPALLEAGMKYAPISVNAKDMDVVKSRQMVRQEVAALWRIPAYKIGAGETEKYDNKSTAEQTYVDDALVPVALRVESCLERAFLTERERMDGYTFVFDRDDLYDRDRQAASDRVVKQYMEGIITRGEARQKLGHGAVENNLDTYRVPVNAAILHQDGQLEYVTPIGANDPQNSTDDPLPAPEKSLRRTIQ
jgi:HK97 family phage portal protein